MTVISIPIWSAESDRVLRLSGERRWNCSQDTNSIFTNSVFWRRVHLLQIKREIKKKKFLFLTHYENTLMKSARLLNKRFTL